MIAWLTLRALRNRLGPNLLTALAVAVAVAVALVVPLALGALREGAVRAASVFDLLVAAKGSPTQAVLNTIFLQEAPVGNIPYELFERLRDDPRTRRAIPLGFGDNYNGFQLVGTTAAFFDLRETLTTPPLYRLAAGRLFEGRYEAVVGAQAAHASGLTPGATFESSHGLAPSLEGDTHGRPYLVVGVLAPTGGPGDRGIYVPIESVWEVHGQGEHAAGEPAAQEPERREVHEPEPREVTAILYTPTRLGYVYQVASELQDGPHAQGIFPGQVLGRLLDLMGQGRAGYAVLGSAVLLLAAATVALNVLASALAGQRNLAVLRAIGARAGTILAVVLLEALAVTTAGVLLGVGLAYAGSAAAGAIVAREVGLTLPAVALEPADYLRALALLPVALAFAVAPALAAVRRSPLERLG